MHSFGNTWSYMLIVLMLLLLCFICCEFAVLTMFIFHIASFCYLYSLFQILLGLLRMLHNYETMTYGVLSSGSLNGGYKFFLKRKILLARQRQISIKASMVIMWHACMCGENGISCLWRKHYRFSSTQKLIVKWWCLAKIFHK